MNMSQDKTDLIYDALIDFRTECRQEFVEIKQNARIHSEEMRKHKEDTSAEFKQLDKRIDKIEQPSKTLATLKSWALWVIAIAAATAHLKGLL
jgi:hypothetical protein